MSLEILLQSKHQLNVLLGIKDSKPSLVSSQGPERQPRQLLVALLLDQMLVHLPRGIYKAIYIKCPPECGNSGKWDKLPRPTLK